MKKRIFALVLLAIIATVAYFAFEQSGHQKRFVVGFVCLTPVDLQTLDGFKKGMAEHGYIENKNIVYLNDGPAGEIDRLDGIIQKQLNQGVDLFFVSSTPATRAVQQATLNTKIPVVFTPVNDPVASGFVASLKYPGGNLTGIRLPQDEKGRFLWLLKMAPTAKKILLPYSPGDKSSELSRMEAFYAADRAGVVLIDEPISETMPLLTILERRKTEADAIFMARDSAIEAQITAFVAVSDEYKLPLSAPSLQQTEAGALFSYGHIHTEMGRQAADLADRILKGASPASLPVQTAKNHLVINLDTAKKINLVLPHEALQKADRIIETGDGK